MLQPGTSLQQQKVTEKLGKARVATLVLVLLLACSLAGNWLLYKQRSETRALALNGFERGYLAASIDAVRGDLSMLGLGEINARIIKLRATSAQLGFPNPDTLRFYGIIPWEDYFKDPSAKVASEQNKSRSNLR